MKRVLAAAALAAAALPVTSAHAEPPQDPTRPIICIPVPAIYVLGDQMTDPFQLCIPGPP